MNIQSHVKGICWTSLAAILVAQRMLAAEAAPSSVIAPYVSDDTFVAAYGNLADLSKQDAKDESALFAVLPFLGSEAESATGTIRLIDQAVRTMAAAGAEAFYAVAGLADLNQSGGPLVILQTAPNKDPSQVAKALKELLGALGVPAQEFEVRIASANTVLAGRPQTLERYANFTASDRAELISPIGKLVQADSVLGFVVCPGSNARRVVRELWPQLPGELAPLDGKLVDRWRHFEVSVDSSPAALPTMTLEASDAEAAQIFAQLWKEFPNALPLLNDDGSLPETTQQYAKTLVDALPPKVEGNRVSLAFPSDQAKVTKLSKQAGEAADASRASAQRMNRMQQLKELALGVLNYESARKVFPPAAIKDQQGRPLLSWRVAILPYLEQMDLYKQFHLDEPWDSDHNRRLIEKMPSIYADPEPKLQAVIGTGKTIFQAPAGPEMIFHGKDGTIYRDIAGGTDKTILLVEVEPSRAVEWTKPQDWSVDLKNPLEGVKRDDRPAFTAVFADGHVEMIPNDVDRAKLRGMLTRAEDKDVR